LGGQAPHELLDRALGGGRQAVTCRVAGGGGGGDDDDVAPHASQVRQRRVHQGEESGGGLGQLASHPRGRYARQVDHGHVRAGAVGQDADAAEPGADPVDRGRERGVRVVVGGIVVGGESFALHGAPVPAQLARQVDRLGGAIAQHQGDVGELGGQ